MGDLVLKGATSGQITVTPTAIAGTNTLTLPAKTGNIITSADSGTVTQAMLASNVAGNGPAFSAYRSASSQSFTTTTWTKVQFPNEYFDTASCYDNSTNYRFTPNVAGYYQVNFGVSIENSGSFSRALCSLYKNGSEYQRGTDGASQGMSGSAVVYLNGSTDYIEIYVWASGTSLIVNSSSAASWFNGALMRAA